ncbi:MAG: hypothetical protein WAO28_01815 [Candidatus Microsaccharimonas sp.]
MKNPEGSPEVPAENAVEAKIEDESPTRFDFSAVAQALMSTNPTLARGMWMALANGEAGEIPQEDALSTLQGMFWDMVDGAMWPNGRMVEEVLKEVMPDYKSAMGLPDREGLELDHILGSLGLVASRGFFSSGGE